MFLWWEHGDMRRRSESADAWDMWSHSLLYILYVAGVHMEAGDANSGPHLIPSTSAGRVGFGRWYIFDLLSQPLYHHWLLYVFNIYFFIICHLHSFKLEFVVILDFVSVYYIDSLLEIYGSVLPGFSFCLLAWFVPCLLTVSFLLSYICWE